MKTVHMIAYVLLIIGGLNWLLVAFDFNIVEKLLGSWPMVVKIINILVGLSAIFEAVTHKARCKHCGEGMPAQM